MSRVIDFHAHIYPQWVAAKILPAAKRKLKVEVPGTGSPQDLCGMMQAAGVAQSVLLPLAKGREDVSSLNDWILSVSKENQELTAFGAVHPFMQNLETELDRLAAWGIRGVKMMPLLQEVYPDDPRCGRLFEALTERKMILVSHAGRDPLDRPEVFGTPDRFARTIECYPDLKMVLAHLGGLRMWDDVRRYLLSAGGNVYFDTAYVSFYMGQEEMKELIGDIGPERILFGSDYPWEEPGRAAEIIRGLELCESEEQAVLGKNAAKLLGMNMD
ncbi:MAG: amidohydrolase family protein [Methanothrix sp.]|nr:amidohydrolase family protein [Methanothrix sp.]MDD4447099.1 amidohydrolase family protein [Methanothrix sp.]